MVDAVVEVHRHLGPGYVESVYENALVSSSLGHDVGEGRMHLLIEHCVVMELGAVERLTDVHVAQALSSLKATGHPLALLINFNVPVLLRGKKRLVRNRSSSPAEGNSMAPDPGGDQK